MIVSLAGRSDSISSQKLPASLSAPGKNRLLFYDFPDILSRVTNLPEENST